MPGKISNYLENALLQQVLGLAPFTGPQTSQLHLGLCTNFVEANDGDSYAEVIGSGYLRLPIQLTAPVGGITRNSQDLVYPEATGNWGLPTHWIVTDAASGGHILYWGAFENPLPILAGEQLEIDAQALTVELSGAATPALANVLLGMSLRGGAWTLGSGTFVGLLTAYTNQTTFSEIIDPAYVRKSASWQPVSGGASSSAARLDWNPFAQAVTISHLGLFNAAGSGSLMLCQPLSTPVSLGAGKFLRIEAGNLRVTLD